MLKRVITYIRVLFRRFNMWRQIRAERFDVKLQERFILERIKGLRAEANQLRKNGEQGKYTKRDWKKVWKTIGQLEDQVDELGRQHRRLYESLAASENAYRFLKAVNF